MSIGSNGLPRFTNPDDFGKKLVDLTQCGFGGSRPNSSGSCDSYYTGGLGFKISPPEGSYSSSTHQSSSQMSGMARTAGTHCNPG